MTQSNQVNVKGNKDKVFGVRYGEIIKCDLFKPKDGDCLCSYYIAEFLTIGLITGPKNNNPRIFFFILKTKKLIGNMAFILFFKFMEKSDKIRKLL